MKVKIDKINGIISFNNVEVKIQKIYFKKYDDVERLNKDLSKQLNFTRKSDEEKAKKHYYNALQIFYANDISMISNENLIAINHLENRFIPKMTNYNPTVDYETKILNKQEKEGLYDL